MVDDALRELERRCRAASYLENEIAWPEYVSRQLRELINLEEPGWPLVQSWLKDAKNPVEVLPAERCQGEATLLAVQVTSRSPMGAIALECGGILFDRGWVRLLGAGCPRMSGSLASWNGLEGTDPQPKLEGAFVIAHDAVGGFFALNGGALGPQKNVHYGAPDSLSWEDTDMGYSDFVHWLAHGDLAGYYEDLRWPGWEDEVACLSGDQGICVWPPLFTVEGKKARLEGHQHRKAVPMWELWGLWHTFRDQLGP